MAKYGEHNVEPIHEIAARLLSHCLQGNGSLLTENVELWTITNLEKIHNVFVAAPDEGERSFIEKYRDQIQPAGTEICNLAAELVTVYFLFPSNVGAARKKEVISEVLAWANMVFPEDGLLTEALSEGIGSGGQGYNTRRPYEIAFLIEFAIYWKRLPENERYAAISDPWAFMEIVDRVDGADGRQGRHMLLHLLFPDTFERIASRDHKRRVVTAFASLLEADTSDDLDRSLFVIREKLAALLGTHELDFYWSPLLEVWNDTGETGESAVSMDALRYKKQIVLYGPPGTGKTFRAKRIANRLIRSALLAKLGPKTYFEKANSDELANEIQKRIKRIQLHPTFGYEDFIRGLHINQSGKTEYRLGVLPMLVKQMAESDPDIPYVLILDEINRTDLSRMLGECFSLLEDRGEEVTLPGAAEVPMTLAIPKNLYVIGTMNLIDQSIEQMDFALRRRFLWISCPFDGESLVSAAKYLWDREPCRVEWDRVENDFLLLAKAAEALNKQIKSSPLLGEQYEIGHTYLLDTVSFLKDDLSSRPKTFLWKMDGKAKRPVEQIWELSLKPLILEYLSGLDSKARESEIGKLASSFLSVSPEVS